MIRAAATPPDGPLREPAAPRAGDGTAYVEVLWSQGASTA
jgi:hypothetical protein